MEQIKKKMKNASLKKSFIYAMSCTVAIIVLLSALTILGCIFLQKAILPDSDDVFLRITTIGADGSETTYSHRMKFGSNEEMPKLIADENGAETPDKPEIIKYFIDKIEDGYMSLSPKRKAAYSVLSAATILLPAIYSIVGILLCAMWFYRKKLDNPIKILSAATKNIANENLDFTVQYDSTDEMGKLCYSFEKMRQTLYENNRKLWHMLEERRMLQASVAHDLRNPIAIIEGYIEYLQQNIPAGKVSEEKLLYILSNLSTAANRLEGYTDSIRDIHHLEDLEIHRTKSILPNLLTEMADDFTVMAKQENLTTEITTSVPKCEVMIDKQVLYRILENIFTNALRFARNTIWMEFSLENYILIAKIEDDGNGFSEKILKSKDRYTFSTDSSGRHIGMGLVTSRILCKKHGGELNLSNQPAGGAMAEIRIFVK